MRTSYFTGQQEVQNLVGNRAMLVFSKGQTTSEPSGRLVQNVGS